jgi:glycosyltransferase involved in cell wall biosynthesis
VTRVLFTIPSLEGGGAERVLTTLLIHLDRSRFEPHLALVTRTGTHLARVPPDVPVHDLGGRGPLAFWRLARLIRRLRPDTVFSSLTFYSTLVLLLRPFCPPGIRFVARENSLPTVHVPRMPYGWLRRRLYAPAHRKADRVVCQTREMADDAVRAGVPPDRVVVLPNPLDTAAVRARGEGPSPYPQGTEAVAAAGRLVPAKGFDLLLTAFARVIAERPDATLHLLGDGPERAALEERARSLGIARRVVFHGFMEDPYPHLRHARMFVLPSRYEGFPNVVLETLALGTPVVAFDCPGGSAVVDGVNGRVVPAGDTDALAAGIVAALAEPPPDRKRVAESVGGHDVGRVIRAFEAVLAGEPEKILPPA